MTDALPETTHYFLPLLEAWVNLLLICYVKTLAFEQIKELLKVMTKHFRELGLILAVFLPLSCVT